MKKKTLALLSQENLPKIIEILEACGFNDKRKKYVPIAKKAASLLLQAAQEIEAELKERGVKAECWKVGTEALRDFGASGYDYKSYGGTFTHHPAGYRCHIIRTKKGWELVEVKERCGENPGWEITKLTPKAAAAICKNQPSIVKLAFYTPKQ